MAENRPAIAVRGSHRPHHGRAAPVASIRGRLGRLLPGAPPWVRIAFDRFDLPLYCDRLDPGRRAPVRWAGDCAVCRRCSWIRDPTRRGGGGRDHTPGSARRAKEPGAVLDAIGYWGNRTPARALDPTRPTRFDDAHVELSVDRFEAPFITTPNEPARIGPTP